MANIGSPLAFPFPRGKRDEGISLGGGGKEDGARDRRRHFLPRPWICNSVNRKKGEKGGRKCLWPEVVLVFFCPLFVWGFGVCVCYYFHLQTSTKRAIVMSLPPSCAVFTALASDTHTPKNGGTVGKKQMIPFLPSPSPLPLPHIQKRGVWDCGCETAREASSEEGGGNIRYRSPPTLQ